MFPISRLRATQKGRLNDGFHTDERNMMMLYSPGTRSGLCEALTLMKEQLSEDESELFALADSVLRKVSAMDDAAFEKLNLYPD